MSNSLVTIDMVTREALRIAHETCSFIDTTDRQYDDSFAKTGAKIGSTLRVRKPNKYVRTQGSRVMDVQIKPKPLPRSPWRRKITSICVSTVPNCL